MNNNIEVWKDIQGYEGLYQVSNLGRVKSLTKNVIMKQHLGRNGNTARKVAQYTLDGKFIKEWPSTMECQRHGFISTAVCACCNGRRKTHKGYIWKYVE